MVQNTTVAGVARRLPANSIVNQMYVTLRAAAQNAILEYATQKKYSKNYIRKAHEIALRYINDVMNKLNVGEIFTDFNPDMEIMWHISMVDNNLQVVRRTFEDDGEIVDVLNWANYMAALCSMLIND